MDHKQGPDRSQLFMFSLESAIANDAFVRVVDAFVDAIDLKSFGFSHVDVQEEGRPPYHPSVLLKLYLYGYRYGIRTMTSSRLFHQRPRRQKMKVCIRMQTLHMIRITTCIFVRKATG